MSSNEGQVLFVTNHHLFRECLANGLTARNPTLAIDTADTIRRGYELCDSQTYTLAVFDADPPDPFTPAMTREFKQKHHGTEVIVVGRCRNEDEAIAFLEAGASDFRVTDSESLDEFCEAIQSTLRGEVTHRPERTRALFARLRKLSAEVSRINAIDTMVLTDREMEILQLLDEGQSNKQVAQALHISLHTVKNHVHRILEKLQVSNRREAVHLAYNNGWLKVEAN
ncbi:MAG TPA: response regulator transcription factor [Pirellulaceae bacterium]|nr:response regulator transcription factor [Pirellulaceae bacterium]